MSKKFEAGVIWFFVSVMLLVVFLYAFFPESFILTGNVGSGGGLVGLTVLDPEVSIAIVSPENTTYNYVYGDIYNISLNVTSDFEVNTWW